MLTEENKLVQLVRERGFFLCYIDGTTTRANTQSRPLDKWWHCAQGQVWLNYNYTNYKKWQDIRLESATGVRKGRSVSGRSGIAVISSDTLVLQGGGGEISRKCLRFLDCNFIRWVKSRCPSKVSNQIKALFFFPEQLEGIPDKKLLQTTWLCLGSHNKGSSVMGYEYHCCCVICSLCSWFVASGSINPLSLPSLLSYFSTLHCVQSTEYFSFDILILGCFDENALRTHWKHVNENALMLIQLDTYQCFDTSLILILSYFRTFIFWLFEVLSYFDASILYAFYFETLIRWCFHIFIRWYCCIP